MSWLLTSLARTLSRIRSAIRRFAGVSPEDVFAPPVYWDDGVALTLTDLVQETETRASGRVQVITLADFRAVIGELWEKYESRILLIAESTISRNVGKGNTYIAQDKDTWLLLFPALSETEAIKRADFIASKIGEKLVGARFTEVPPPLPEACKLDLGSALNADGTLNLERIKAAVEKVRQSAAVKSGLAADRLKAPSKGPARASPSAAQPVMERSEANQLTVALRPAWNGETHSVSTFYFRATKPDGTDVFTATGPAPNDSTAIELLNIAVRIFGELYERGLRAVLTVPVPYPALLGPRVTEIQRLIAGLPQRSRLVHLRIEITNLPAHVGADSLVPIRELFRPYVREVAFLLDLSHISEQVLALDHIMVGVEVARGTRSGDDDLFQAMLVFRQRAGRRPTYILGLASRLQVSHAVTAGIAEIGGPGVTSELRKLPDHIIVMPRKDLVL